MKNLNLNPILIQILEARNGHYIHALEVQDVQELESCIEQLCDEFISQDHSIIDIKDFFDSMSIYCTEEENEEEVYNFIPSLFIDSLCII